MNTNQTHGDDSQTQQILGANVRQSEPRSALWQDNCKHLPQNCKEVEEGWSTCPKKSKAQRPQDSGG